VNVGVLLNYREELPVRSVVLLLRPKADGPEMNGVFDQRLPDGDRYLEFRYQVVRAWERPVDAILEGDLGTLPLAPLADVTPEALPGVVRRMRGRLEGEASPEERAMLWSATYILMGLRYPKELAQRLLQGVRDMRESTTYQAILAEGKAEEGRRFLLKLGRKRFGAPEERTVEAIEALEDLGRIELLGDRLLDVSSWDELLAAP